MSNVVSLQARDDEKLAAGVLTRQVEQMAGTGLVVQLNALVVERQQTVVFVDEEPISRDVTLQYQEAVKREASATLSTMLPRIVTVAGSAPGEAASLITITIAQFRHQGIAAAVLLSILKAVQDRLKLYRVDAGSLAADLTHGAAELKETHAEFAKHIEKQVAALDGPNGAIAQTVTQIEKTRKAMEKALDDIVKSGNAVSSGVQNLITGIIHVFTAASKPDTGTTSKPDKETASKPDTGTTSKPGTGTTSKPAAVSKPGSSDTTSSAGKPATAAKPKIVTSEVTRSVAHPTTRGTPDFSVESITAITSGIEGSETASATYQSHVETLIGLYNQLYRQKATLAMTTAINVQVGMLEASMRKAAAAARAVQAAYADIEQGLAGEIKDLKAADDPATQIAGLAARLDATLTASWRRLETQAAIIKQNFAGTR